MTKRENACVFVVGKREQSTTSNIDQETAAQTSLYSLCLQLTTPMDSTSSMWYVT